MGLGPTAHVTQAETALIDAELTSQQEHEERVSKAVCYRLSWVLEEAAMRVAQVIKLAWWSSMAVAELQRRHGRDAGPPWLAA